MNWHQNDNQRIMPWKEESDPYKVWLSEVILQQTQVKQGLSYYEKFTTKYPTIEHLASANEDQVLADWQGLGYNSRGRNLLKAAKQIVEEYSGEFPNSKEKLLQLPGVGDYIASAVASFAFGEQTAVLDANVYRVISRWYLIEEEIQTPKAHKLFSELIQSQLGSSPAKLFNQAIMDFGATICTPKQPLCMQCPIQAECGAQTVEQAKLFPKKKKKLARKQLFLHLFLVEQNGRIGLVRRPDKGIWPNMFSLPYIESEHAQFPSHNPYSFSQDRSPIIDTAKQLLSHREVHAILYQIEYFQDTQVQDIEWIEVKKLENYAFPSVVLEFIKKFYIFN